VSADGSGREPIGRYIAQQRQLRGIDLAELAARTRIPRRSLERLEAGAFDRSPDGFSRGFVRTVAEAIGLDADDAVARMLPEPDAAQLGPPRAALWIVAGVVLTLVAGAALLLRARTSGPAASPTVASGLPVRTDYVRALAEANGIAARELTGRDAVLPPPEPEPVQPEIAAAESDAAAAAPPKARASKPALPAAPRTPAPQAPATSSPSSATAAAPRPLAPNQQTPSPASPASAPADEPTAPPAPAPAEAAATDTQAAEPAPSLDAVAPPSSPTSTEPESPPASDAEADD
jgi:transcriptional regulator with XRE-family HTH domain